MGSVFSRLLTCVYHKCIDRTCAKDIATTATNTTTNPVVTIRQPPVGNRKTSMDVTRHNFLETLREIEAIISAADFATIDTELSGLRRLDTKGMQLLDTADERYAKLKQSIAGFSLIQFGLTCFQAVPNDTADGHHYACHSYNFYIFPQKSSGINKAMGDRVFSVQTSSLQFLASNGFDFNKLIIDGISYLNDAEEKLCVEAIEAQKKANAESAAANSSTTGGKSSPAVSALTDEDKRFVDEIVVKVREFMADESRETIDLSPCNAFKRRLIYESLKSQDFNDSVEMKTVMVSQNSSDRYVSVSKVDKLVKERKDEESLTEAIGFSKIIQLLIKYQKPIIGHNVLLDLMHTFNQFIEPLPNDYKTFRNLIHAIFPIVYDTKHIASAPVFKDKLENTALGDLHERLKTSPFKTIDVELKNGKHCDGKALHEAGYDSYVTGVCFVGLVHYLGSLVDPKVTRFDAILLGDYQNKLFLTYSHDIHHFNLEADEPVPNRDHVFHVTFPKEWKTNELFHLFSAFGGVAIGWVNETSALCALKDPSNADKIRKSLLKTTSTNSTYKVISYKEFVAKQSAQSSSSSSTPTSAVADDVRDGLKRNAKSRASPQTPNANPYKKSKVIDAKSPAAEKVTPNVSKHKPKLFEEPADWEVDIN
ncbi:unnamed protein product [Oppiella nova]|uniref:Poly(A)-specific ribonuclease RNA-binding domain-containing protein n=1 Tax=Oppiella nova TaxID=334625 RepID=A0A7R9LFY1_9ACAR|nr:unnamed protein product [Oppiella nova]CAG2163274.1 unnamed protein product [Oppiella nova]